MVRIVWSRDALASLDLIVRYIAQFDPNAAKGLATRLLEAAESLSHFPSRGRIAPGGRRELAILAPYILVYRLTGDQLVIERVRHSAMADDSH